MYNMIRTVYQIYGEGEVTTTNGICLHVSNGAYISRYNIYMKTPTEYNNRWRFGFGFRSVVHVHFFSDASHLDPHFPPPTPHSPLSTAHSPLSILRRPPHPVAPHIALLLLALWSTPNMVSLFHAAVAAVVKLCYLRNSISTSASNPGGLRAYILGGLSDAALTLAPKYTHPTIIYTSNCGKSFGNCALDPPCHACVPGIAPR